MDVQGQAEGGNFGLVVPLDGGGADGDTVFADDGGDLTEHIDPVVGDDGDGDTDDNGGSDIPPVINP